MPAGVSCSASYPRKSRWLPRWVVATLTLIPVCGKPYKRPATKACPSITSTAPSKKAPVNSPASITRNSPTKATPPAESPCSSRPPPTTKTAPPPKSAPSSPKTAATWPDPAASPGCSIAKASSTSRPAKTTEDDILNATLDAGAEDVRGDENGFEIITPVDKLEPVNEALKKAGIVSVSAKLLYLPDNQTAVTETAVAEQVLRLYEALDDHDDVQNVHANFDIAADLLAKVSI